MTDRNAGILKLWLQRSGRSAIPQGDLKEIRDALGQIHQAIDAMAVEVERLSEGQRFTTKLLAEQTVVGAIDSSNAKRTYSDYGRCGSVFAPGVQVTSMGLGGSPNVSDGTSAAAPIVAGVVASILQNMRDGPDGLGYASETEAFYVITDGADSGVVLNAMGSPARRVNSLHPYFHVHGTNSVITSETQTITWTLSNLIGGDGNWSNFVWNVSYDHVTTTVEGTGPSYTRTIPAGSTLSFGLIPSGTSAGETVRPMGIWVTVKRPPNCQINCPK